MLSQFLQDVLFVRENRGKRIVHVRKNKIIFAHAMDNDVVIITIDGKKYVYHSSFSLFLAQMKPVDLFRRVHRCHAIRIDCIAETYPDDLYVVLEEKCKNILAVHFTGDDSFETVKFGKEYMAALRRIIDGPGTQPELPFP